MSSKILRVDLHRHVVMLSTLILKHDARFDPSKDTPLREVFPITRKFVKDLITHVVDDGGYWSTSQWDDTRAVFDDHFIDEMRPLASIFDVIEDTEGHLRAVINLPTWEVYEFTIRSDVARFESQGDYRVIQWEEEHAHEYPKYRRPIDPKDPDRHLTVRGVLSGYHTPGRRR